MLKPMAILAVTIVFLGTACLGAPPAGGDGYDWQVVFEDNFEGNSLDTSKWNYNLPWSTYHNHRANYQASQVEVQDGKLIITAVAERSIWNPWEIWRDDFGRLVLDYTSGAINTHGKFHMTHGYIEGSFKMPPVRSTWPAFWMLKDGWPPEIDIFEVENERNKFHYYYHYTRSGGGNTSFGGIRWTHDLSNSFNTFGLEWTPTEMAWYFNGQQVYRHSNPTAIEQAENMYLIINLGVGGWAPDPDSADYPTSMEVDWVRVWQRKPSPVVNYEGYWPLNETSGTTAADKSGKQRTGNLRNGMSFSNDSVDAPTGTGLRFAGNNEHIRLGSGFRELDNGFSVSFWAKPEAVSSWSRFIDLGNGPEQDNIYLARRGTSDTLIFSIYSSGNWSYIEAQGAIELDKWQFFTATVDASGSARIYKDGQMIAEGNISRPPMVSRTRNYVGRSNWSSDAYFQGAMADIRMFNYALEADEIMALYSPSTSKNLAHHWKLNDQADWFAEDNLSKTLIWDWAAQQANPLVTSASAMHRNLVSFGEPPAAGHTENSIHFGGRNERLLLGPVAPGIDDFSISLWFNMSRFRGVGPDNTDHILSAEHRYQGNGWCLQLWRPEINEPVELQFNQPGYGTVTILDDVDENNWHHIVLTRDQYLNFSIYADDQLVHSGQNGVRFNNDGQTKGVWLGQQPGMVSYFTGWIDDLRIYDFAVYGTPDYTGDGTVASLDFAKFSEFWLDEDCQGCHGFDFNLDSTVDWLDLAIFADYWLADNL